MDCAGATPGRNEQATQTQGPYLFPIMEWKLYTLELNKWLICYPILQLEAEGCSNYRTLQHAAWPAPGSTMVEHDGATYHVHPTTAQSVASDCEPTLQIGYNTLVDRNYIYSRNANTHTCCWCSLITNKPDRHCSVLIINQTKLTLFSGTLLITSFCLPRQPIISQGAPLEARTTSCWDGFFELLC
jgi:hypothetical protein